LIAVSIPGLDPSAAPVLRRGSSGDWVAFLQGALTVLGYDTGAPDGEFGPNTERAVQAFQADHALTADGVVGPRTWAAIAEAGASAAGGSGTTPGGSTPSGRRELDPDTAPVLERNDEGDWVLYLQNLLVAAGEDTGPLDGDFGPITQGAVMRFQGSAGISVDGDVGPHTWGALKPFADVHPMEPPYGSAVHHGGGGHPGGQPGGGGHGGGHGVTVAVQPEDQIVDESLMFHLPVTNGGGQRVYVRHVAWEASSQGRSMASEELIEDWLEPGQMAEASVPFNTGPAPQGETYDFVMQATAIYELENSDADLRTATVARTVTVDDQGRTSSGTAPSGGGSKEPTGSEVSLTVIPDSELDTVGDGLNLNFDVLNASSVEVVIMSIEWTVTSGVSRQSGHVDPPDVLGPAGSMDASDVVPMGPASDEPYACTASATVVYAVGTEVKRSAPASSSFTIDGEGKVNGTARGPGGGGGAEPTGAPSYQLNVTAPHAVMDNGLLFAAAQVLNNGDAAGDVEVTATLSGAMSSSNSTHSPGLLPSEGIVAEVSVMLPPDRTDTFLFVLDCGFTSAEGASQQSSIGLTVTPDGTVTQG